MCSSFATKHHLTTSTSALSKSFRFCFHLKIPERDDVIKFYLLYVSRALSFLACSVRCNSSKFSDYSAEFQKMHDYFQVLWQSKIFQMRKPAEGKSSVYRDARSKHTGNTSTLWGGGIPNDHKWVEAEWRHLFHIRGPTRARHRSWIFYTLRKKMASSCDQCMAFQIWP